MGQLREIVPTAQPWRPPLNSPTTETEESATAPGTAAEPVATEPTSRLFQALSRLRTFEALRYREFRLLWLGQLSTAMGTWMDQVARGWLIYQLTNSPAQLGLVRGVQAIPIFLLSPIAGSVADRYARKKQVVVVQLLDGLMYAAMAALILTGRIKPWHVYVTAFGMSIVQTFHHPARAAMVADAVPLSHLTNAIGLNSVVFNMSRSTGPAVAGVLIAMFGTGASYVVQAAFFFLATFLTSVLSIGQSPPTSTHGHAGKEAFGRSIVEGWRFSWSNESVRAGLVITMAASFFIIPFTTLLPVFAKDILEVGATGQGFLLTGMGVGALSSAVLIASIGDRVPRGHVMLGGVILYGLSVVAFSVSPWFKLSIVLMIVVGLFHVTSHALVQTVIQTYSLPEFRGRTMAIFQQGHFVLTIGAMIYGALASLLGAQWTVSMMATVGALSMVLIYITLPSARRIR